MKRALLQLAQITATDLGLMREIVLRQALGVAQPTQIGGKNFPQIHLGKECLLFDI